MKDHNPHPASTQAKARRFGRRKRGSAMVEVSLALPVLLLFLFGMMEFGMIFSRYQVVLGAAREGARVGTLFRIDCVPGDVFDEIRTVVADAGNQFDLNLDPTNNPSATLSVNGLCQSGRNIVVQVTFRHKLQLIAGMLSETYNFVDIPLVAQVTMRNEM